MLPAALLLLGLVIAIPGIDTLPPDAHEAFVARTAQEMAERGDWIVPWFNGEPRLNKPPLSYWIAAALAGGDGIQLLHARLVSVLAGVGMVLVTFFTGCRLLGRRNATWSCLILVSSLGFFSYTHDGRPDMLYAFFIDLAGLGLVAAWQSAASARRRAAGSLMWSALALATLAKGPHMPAAFLVAAAVSMRLETRSWREVVSRIGPLSGLLLFLLLVAPWWLMLRSRLGAGGLEGTQLTGSLLKPDPSKLFTLHYTYATFLLILPWLAALPGTLHALLARRRHAPALRLLGLWVFVAALMLSFGPQARNVYMLPCLMPLSLLLAMGMREMQLLRRGRAWLPVVAATATLQLAAPLAVMARWTSIHTGYPFATWGAFTAAFLFLLAYFLHYRLRYDLTPGRIIAATSIALAGAYVVLGASGSAWSDERYEYARVAASAVAQAAPSGPLVMFRQEADVVVYYAQRPVPELVTLKQVRQQLQAAPGGHLIVMTDIRQVPILRKGAALTILDRTHDGRTHPVVVARLQLAATATLQGSG